MKQRVADYIADFFVQNDMEDIFTVPGGGAMQLNDAFGQHPKLRCTYNHHEQACAIAAEAYARYSRKIAPVCVTSGPGGTNALTGVLCAWDDSIPMFVVSGQIKFITSIKSTSVPLRQLGDQEFNITDCVKTMTKLAQMIINPYDIAYYLEKALFLALNGRPGPVWLDIPLNVQGAIIETENLRHYENTEDMREIPPVFTDRKAHEIIDRIRNSRRPVLLVGTAVRGSGAHSDFIRLIEKLRIPVVTAWNAHDALEDESPFYCGRPGTIGNRGGNFVVQNSDLLIIMGCRLNIRQISYNWENFAPNTYKIMVDIDPSELIKPTLSIDYPVHADVKDVISKMNENMDGINNAHEKWLQWANSINKKYPVCLPEYYRKGSPVNPYVFLTELFLQLENDDAIVSGNGSACVCGFQSAIIKGDQRLFTNSGCATMGYGLPGAIGVSTLRNPKRTICLDGDGSFQMNLQELETVVYNKLNIKIIIINNNGYHSMRQTQSNLFNGRLYGVSKENGIDFPDFERIAYAYRVPFYRVTELGECSSLIHKALSENGPVILECIVDPEQFFAPKLSSKILDDGRIISPPLDDLFPFLSDEEKETIKNEVSAI